MFYPPYPFPFWQPQMAPNNKPKVRGNRAGRKERNMTRDFMKFIREHESVQKEWEEFIKTKEKKEEKKDEKHHGKANPIVTGMVVFGLAQMMSLGWVYILLQVAPAIVNK